MSGFLEVLVRVSHYNFYYLPRVSERSSVWSFGVRFDVGSDRPLITDYRLSIAG